MKNNLVTILLLILTISSYAQQKLTIEECYALAEKNYPIAKQTNFLQQKTTFEIDALNKAKLPKIDINAQATYQSDVIGLPTSLPGVEPINKDQYRATLDVNQLLYNGGMINANTKLKEAQMLTQQQLVAVNLYQLKSRINYSYMMILLWQDQRELLLAKQSTIHSKIKEVKSGVKNGAMLPSSEQVLEAELLKLEQALTENTFQRIKELQNLAGLTSITIKENSVLERPSSALEKNGIQAEAIHGDKSQNARQRVLEQFKNKEIDILVATDIAARGIDIEQLPFVINFDIPNISETYVHRIGRTGRAGNSGLAISFCGKDEKPYWQDIEKLIRMKVKVITDHQYTWKDAEVNPDAKPDLRNKNKMNPNSNSRKSEASKKNKKRWY